MYQKHSTKRAFRRILTGLTLVAGSAGFAAADTISLVGNSIVQTASFGGTGVATDVGGVGEANTAQTFLDFTDAAAAAGAPVGSVLSSVYLQESINETITGLTISYTNPQTGGSTGNEGFVYDSTAMFLVNGTAPDASNLTSSPTGMLYSIGNSGFGTPSQEFISYDQYLNFLGTPAPATGANTAGTVDNSQVGLYAANNGNGLGPRFYCFENPGAGAPYCSDLSPWTYTTSYMDNTPSSAYVNGGSFTLGYQTITSETFVGGGGNLDAAQTTTTDATMEVIYNFTTTSEPASIPEPASMVLMGSALLGLGLLGRRRKNAARS